MSTTARSVPSPTASPTSRTSTRASWPLTSLPAASAPPPDATALRECVAILICLPTPLDEHRNPDLRAVLSGARTAAANLGPGTLVVLESTTYPGTTREEIQPILEATGRTVGEDVFLAFSPERVDPGNPKFGIRNTPKVVGGITPECTKLAAALYSRICEQVYVVSTPESAEMAKILENTFRAVNIALVNEMAILADRMNIDIWEAIGAASTKPFGFMPFWPGPGARAATASRWIPSTCRGAPRPTTSPRSSWSWPAASTWGCRTTRSRA